MKKLFPFLLAASLAVNAALAVLMFQSDEPAAPAALAAVAPAGASTAPLAPAAPGIQLATEALPALADKDLPSTVAELRAAGFPPEMVRAIAAALLDERYRARQKALDPDSEKRPFWKEARPNPNVQRELTQLWAERRKEMRDLLGDDAEANDPMTQARRRQQFGNLAPEKMAQAADILREFDEKRSSVYSAGVYTNVERDQVAALDKQQRAALAQVLSPAELEEYDLRSSNTGRTLRNDLVAFNPTEEEFRAIFKLRQPFDEQWNRMYDSGLPNQEDMQRRSTAEKQMKDEIKAALGPIRGADYELTTDFNYRRTSQLVARLELPPETTKQLYDVQQEMQKRMTEIRTTTRNQQDRIAQLTALQEEASAKVSPLLGGARGVEAYKQYGGNWLNNMIPRPPPPKK